MTLKGTKDDPETVEAARASADEPGGLAAEDQLSANPEDRADELAARTEAERRENAPDYKPTP